MNVQRNRFHRGPRKREAASIPQECRHAFGNLTRGKAETIDYKHFMSFGGVHTLTTRLRVYGIFTIRKFGRANRCSRNCLGFTSRQRETAAKRCPPVSKGQFWPANAERAVLVGRSRWGNHHFFPLDDVREVPADGCSVARTKLPSLFAVPRLANISLRFWLYQPCVRTSLPSQSTV